MWGKMDGGRGDNSLFFGPERRGLQMVRFGDVVGCHGQEFVRPLVCLLRLGSNLVSEVEICRVRARFEIMNFGPSYCYATPRIVI
jgi:hypothetical protein